MVRVRFFSYIGRMNLTPVCKTCRGPKATYACGICHEPTCKSCTQFLTEEFRSLRKAVPENLKHPNYCATCFDETVAGPLAEYEEKVKKAQDIIIYTKEQSKETRLIKRKADPYKVEGCEDEEEAVSRIAFYAVEDGFNCIVDVQIFTKKLIVGSHKKTMFAATGYPVKKD